MIPKIIHYCWFGRNPLPADAVKCIESWRKFFPNYEIKEWNEDNFDINILPYAKDAYEAKKYAFVSDYARIYILHQHGGLYFDTDVEVIKPMDEVVTKGAFMGIECISPEHGLMVNPGLGIGAESGHPVYQRILDIYRNLNFCDKNGYLNMYAIVRITSDVLKEFGMNNNHAYQKVSDISIYPADYFNPLDSATEILYTTKNTLTIHWFSYSWGTKQQQRLLTIKRFIRNTLTRLGLR